MTDSSKAKTCTDCASPLGWSMSTCWDKCDYPCEDDKCTAQLCTTCHGKNPLFVVPDGKPSDDFSSSTLKRFCKTCFQTKSAIDFSKTYETIEGDSGVIFVFAHGGAGSRALFLAHAAELNKRFGHTAILWDLPGHASLVDTELSLDSCAETLGNIFEEKSITSTTLRGSLPGIRKEKVIYVGGSLGAYIGFHLVEKFKDIFDGVILIDCGQNVGPGASFKARMGLILLAYLGRNFSNATLLKMMADVTKKSDADYKMLETIFGAGMFFDKAELQVECLRTVAPAEYIPKLNLPILFMNGSKDYRDSENKWLELCVDDKSELKVYDGDHFFTHYSNLVDDILSQFDSFAKKL
eukprot:scaffold64297_cov57-Attheya_sp.AAC.1